MAQKAALSARQKKLLECYEARMCVVTPACQDAGVSRQTFYEWVKTSPAFAEAVEALENIPLDFAENQLFTRMKDKSDAAIIFYLKTKGRGRGYIEKLNVTLDSYTDEELIEEARRRLALRAEAESPRSAETLDSSAPQ